MGEGGGSLQFSSSWFLLQNSSDIISKNFETSLLKMRTFTIKIYYIPESDPNKHTKNHFGTSGTSMNFISFFQHINFSHFSFDSFSMQMEDVRMCVRQK